MATPVLFIHGLWLHATSWQPWTELFTEAGYAPAAPGWPGEQHTVEATRAQPDLVAGYGIDDVVEHYAGIIAQCSPAAPVAAEEPLGAIGRRRPAKVIGVSDFPATLAPVLRDVAATYPVPVRVSPGTPGGGEASIRITTDGESIAEVHVALDRPLADQIADGADQVADWLVEQLPAAGRPAVWPACPLHPGTHPLEVHSDGHRASWVCPRTQQPMALIGELAARSG
jgi:hypothetical protein